MNKSKIEWCDYTWNPITGCHFGCNYCYAEKIALRFTGHFKYEFHPNRLLTPLTKKKSSIVFVGSMADVFGNWVPDEIIQVILEVARFASHHTFLFLTKNPKRFKEFYFSENCWIGFSACNQEDYNKRFKDSLGGVGPRNRFVSLEPIQEKIIFGNKVDWVIVGQETGNRKARIKADPEWTESIVNWCASEEIPLFLKDNLNHPDKIQHFPHKIKELVL